MSHQNLSTEVPTDDQATEARARRAAKRVRLERHNRSMLKMVGLDPARMTKAQITHTPQTLCTNLREVTSQEKPRRQTNPTARQDSNT